MIFIYSLGGFVLAGRDSTSLREYAQDLKELAAKHQIFVVGGDRMAREYIEKARALGASEMFCDTIGISYIIMIGVSNCQVFCSCNYLESLPGKKRN
jgi:uridylate kinase